MEDNKENPASSARKPTEELIDISLFARLKLHVGRIESAEPVAKSNKLVKLQVNLGEEIGLRQVVAGIGKHYPADTLVGRKIVVITNLKPAVLMGEESQGMLLAASTADSALLSLLQPDQDLPPGAVVR